MIRKDREYVLKAMAVGLVMATNSMAAQNWMLTTAPNANWKAVAGSSDGTKLAAAVGGEATAIGPICLSTNSGATWALSTAPGKSWQSIASSSDGVTLVAAALGSIRSEEHTSELQSLRHLVCR